MSKKIFREGEVDTTILYGPLKAAGEYLIRLSAQYPADASLTEVWDGYEDMHMAIGYYTPETAEEERDRKEREEWRRKREAEEAARAIQRAEDFETLRRLKAKLGVI